MTDTNRSPAKLRRMFGANLRQLAQRYPSVSELCRQLGINRTQFNRYLAGESFPRPDILDRICQFFDVDARILLKPLDEIEPHATHPAVNVIDRYLSANVDTTFATGFYQAIERDQTAASQPHHRLYHVREIFNCTLLRGYDPCSSISERPATREVRGIVSYADGKICALISRKGAQDRRMMVLSETSEENGTRLLGYVYRLAEGSELGQSTQRVELRHLGHDLSAALKLARKAKRSTHPR